MLKINGKKLSIIILGLLLINFTMIFANQDVNSYEYLKLKINSNVEFGLNFNNNFNVQKFDLKSFFFPQTFSHAQYLNNFSSSTQNYIILNDSNILNLDYKLKQKDLKNSNKINNEFILESVVTRPKITSKVKYPLSYVSPKNKKYLKFMNLIDTNTQIKDQASKLAQGEDDVFIISSKIAKWLRNDINYDLSTLTKLPNQKSSQVFSSKRGVCKEVSNLYISMIRSLGIPARIVTGYAYTNSHDIYNLIGSNWGGHAWVEVLIGNKWVPFDLTYNQYGFVDATHIVLDKNIEIRHSGIEINASGNGFNIVKNSLKFNNSFEIIDKKKTIYDQGYSINIFGNKKIGFNSYGYIGINIKNNDGFYKIIFLRLSKITDVENLNGIDRMEILKPNEEKIIYFKYKVKSKLNLNYLYTFPFSIYNDYFSQNFSVEVSNKNKDLTLLDLPSKKQDIKKVYSKNKLEFNCNYDILKEKNEIICSILNRNNYILKEVSICIENSYIKNNCRKINFNLNEKKIVFFKSSFLFDIINYSYDNLSFRVNISAKTPKLFYNTNLNKNRLDLNLSIKNYSKNTNTFVYLNSKLIKEFNSQNIDLKLDLNSQINNFKIKTKIFNKSFDNKEFIINVKKENLHFQIIKKEPIIETKINNKVIVDKSNNENFIISFFKSIIMGFKNYFQL